MMMMMGMGIVTKLCSFMREKREHCAERGIGKEGRGREFCAFY